MFKVQCRIKSRADKMCFLIGFHAMPCLTATIRHEEKKEEEKNEKYIGFNFIS